MAKKQRITKKAVQSTEDKPIELPEIEAKPEIDAGPFDDDGLSIRQRQFVAALVGPAGGIARRAAEMAGYASENLNSLDVTASRTLNNAKVQEAIAHALARRRMSPEWAKAQLVDLASTTMSNFVTVGTDGNATLDMAKAAAAGAIGQIKEWNEEVLQVAGSEQAIIKRKIKLHDRTQAMGLLLKLHGLADNNNEPEQEQKQVRVRRVKNNDP